MAASSSSARAGANNASHLKRRFALTLVDRSPGMQAVSRALNPECEHVLGDMRHVRLGANFDAVFIHDAVLYLATRADLALALATAFVHCRPGGGVLLAPDWTRETFVPGTSHGGGDGEDGRGIRCLEWRFDPDPADEQCVCDFALLVREREEVRVVHDRHLFGLFARATWLELLAGAGFGGCRFLPFEHSARVEAGELIVGHRPA